MFTIIDWVKMPRLCTLHSCLVTVSETRISVSACLTYRRGKTLAGKCDDRRRIWSTYQSRLQRALSEDILCVTHSGPLHHLSCWFHCSPANRPSPHYKHKLRLSHNSPWQLAVVWSPCRRLTSVGFTNLFHPILIVTEAYCEPFKHKCA